MSRSNPTQKFRDAPPMGLGFEVGRSVCGVYLKKMSLVEKQKNGYTYYRVDLSFLKNNNWVTKFISFLPKEAFDDEESYINKKLETQNCLENLMACYISPEHMKYIIFQSKTFSIVGYFAEIQKALTEKRFWDTPICLKTVPHQDGGVSVGKFAPFMNKESGSNWTLSYSKWEAAQVAININ